MITKVSITTSATLVSSAKPRAALLIQNLSDTDIFVALEGSADVTADAGAKPGLRLAANGGVLAMGEAAAAGAACNQAIYGIHGGSGSKVLTIQEW